MFIDELSLRSIGRRQGTAFYSSLWERVQHHSGTARTFFDGDAAAGPLHDPSQILQILKKVWGTSP